MNEQVCMNLWTIKQNVNEWVEESYECILTLANSYIGLDFYDICMWLYVNLTFGIDDNLQGEFH
jgi:hypothetical protein